MSVVDGLRNRKPVFSSTGLKVRVLTDEEYDRLLDGMKTLEQIADPSYVGNYDDAHVLSIYIEWARKALAALESTSGTSTERRET